MPTPTDYSNSVIYKICCKDVSIKECYVGSTTNFTNRKSIHKRDCNNNKYNPFVYKFIRENGGWENWDMVLIEKYPCKDKLELFSKEREWKEKLNSKLNKINPINFDGDDFCIHNRMKCRCKECGGSSICEHNKRRLECVECKGSQICEHNKLRKRCKECGGSSICEHDKRKDNCKICSPQLVCEHEKLRIRCKECNPKILCPHNKNKQRCRECGGSQICEHDKRKEHCKVCSPHLLCKHGRFKRMCKECCKEKNTSN